MLVVIVANDFRLNQPVCITKIISAPPIQIINISALKCASILKKLIQRKQDIVTMGLNMDSTLKPSDVKSVIRKCILSDSVTGIF